MTDVAERLNRAEDKIEALGKKAARVDERLTQMHEDMGKLTAALEMNTDALAKWNLFIANKKGFAAGVATTLTLLGAAIGALGTMWFKAIFGPLPPSP